MGPLEFVEQFTEAMVEGEHLTVDERLDLLRRYKDDAPGSAEIDNLAGPLSDKPIDELTVTEQTRLVEAISVFADSEDEAFIQLADDDSDNEEDDEFEEDEDNEPFEEPEDEADDEAVEEEEDEDEAVEEPVGINSPFPTPPRPAPAVQTETPVAVHSRRPGLPWWLVGVVGCLAFLGGQFFASPSNAPPPFTKSEAQLEFNFVKKTLSEENAKLVKTNQELEAQADREHYRSEQLADAVTRLTRINRDFEATAPTDSNVETILQLRALDAETIESLKDGFISLNKAYGDLAAQVDKHNEAHPEQAIVLSPHGLEAVEKANLINSELNKKFDPVESSPSSSATTESELPRD